MRYYSIIFLTMFVCQTNAQRIDKAIDGYSSTYPIEETYLHLDNSLYSAGDTVWFKAYVLENSVPTSFSKNLYVDWFDAAGKLLTHQIYPIQHATANGQFTVPSLYKESKIHLLAYTKWMLNSDTSFLFHRDIVILPFKSQVIKPQKTETQKTVLQFFPEGGNLIAGVINKVAFKATDQFGNPIDLNGIIRDNHNDSVTNFTTTHDGMGYFFLTPQEGTNYLADYHLSSIDSSVNLPEVQPSGIAMEMQFDGNSRRVVIRKSKDMPLDKFYFMATMNGYSKFISVTKIFKHNSMSIPVKVPVSDLPSGIITFTVFNAMWEPLAERVAFIRGKDIGINIPQLSINKQNLNKKGLNSIVLGYDDTIATNLSVAVTDGNIPADTTNNIISYLLLTGQLKGKISNPTYYFEDTSLERQQELDLVMLTNGWRKYNWHQISSKTLPAAKYSRDSVYFFFNGEILNKKNKIPKQLSFLMKSKESFGIYNFRVKKHGLFFDSSIILYDTTSVIYRPEKNPTSFKFNYTQLPQLSFNTYPFSANTSIIKSEQKVLFGALDFYKTDLPDVTVTAYKSQYTNPTDSLETPYESSEFINAPALKNVYVLNDPILPAYGTDMEAFIQARLQIDLTKKPILDPEFFVNGQLTPEDVALQTPIIDIVFMKWYKYFVGAPGGGGMSGTGVIAIWTKQGFPSELYTKDKKVVIPKMVGYTISEEFYLPNYNTTKNKDSINDRRKTLYWNPQVNLDNKDNKSVHLSFYNNDFAKSFRIIIEGIKTDGTPIYIDRRVE